MAYVPKYISKTIGKGGKAKYRYGPAMSGLSAKSRVPKYALDYYRQRVFRNNREPIAAYHRRLERMAKAPDGARFGYGVPRRPSR